MTDTTPENAASSTERVASDAAQAPAPAKKAAARKRAPRKKAAAPAPSTESTTEQSTADEPMVPDAVPDPAADPAADEQPAPVKKVAARKRAPRKKAATASETVEPVAGDQATTEATEDEAIDDGTSEATEASATSFGGLLFQAPDPAAAPPRRRRRAQAPAGPPSAHEEEPTPAAAQDQPSESTTPGVQGSSDDSGEVADDDSGEVAGDGTGEGGGRKRRRRGGRGRRGKTDADDQPDGQDDDQRAAGKAKAQGRGRADAADDESGSADDSEDSEDSGAGDQGDEEGSSSSRRRRRRRRRAGSGDDSGPDDPPGTVTKVRQPRKAEDQVASVKGSTRLEAKKQRRRDGREAGRRKPLITESEFLARRESVERTMIVRERGGRTQIAVLEDDVLVEHYVANETNASMIGNVYLGRVQNVLPSMEAAFIDIGKGRNAVLYAGEVNWDAAGLDGQPRRIEVALKSGDQVLAQVTKDPMGHKGARLTSQISLPGRYLVYVPNGSMTGISRKLPDTERSRLKKILKAVVPEHAGVIVRTAAEGASEAELQRDVERLTEQWADIEKKSTSSAGGSAPKLLHGEPDLTVRVIRDVFNEDFAKLVVSGASAWDVVQPYLASVAPDLAERVSKWTAEGDVFAAHRVDEQLAKAMDRKVWLPSGGSLVIDRTEAMTVVDVNTGKFTGSGGNLEETVTRNNLEAAEEMVRQLRLRDIGGIIVVDFIDMVLESNRDLVLRRMIECLGRDRTRHQVAEVTSLGLVQMTRKRIGTGLLEAFSETCEHCQGRGLIVHHEPVEPKHKSDDEPRRNRRGGRNRGDGDNSNGASAAPSAPSPKDVAAVAKAENADRPPLDEVDQPDGVQPKSNQVEDPRVPQSAMAAGSAPKPAAAEAESAPKPAAAEAESAPEPVRQRKRSARREQGPASTASFDGSNAAVEPDSGDVADQSEAAPQTLRNAPEPVQAAAPRVVTSVRRRSAARPAGPPATDGQGSDPSGVEPAVGIGAAPDNDNELAAAEQPHVPVKRKGSHKR